MKGVVILPVYNDFSKLKDMLSKIVLDVVIINDGSLKPIKPQLIGLKYKKLINYKRNRGKGYALKKGFSYAKDHGYDYVITMDSDGEHDPQDIPAFIKEIQSKDFVIGERQAYRSYLRSLLNFIGGMSFRLLIPGLKDTQSGFRAIKLDLLSNMRLSSDGFEIETEMLLEAYKNGVIFSLIKIKSVPIDFTNVKLKDYIRINDLFDKWVLDNKSYIKINFIKKVFLLILVQIGIVSSFILKKLLK